MSKYFVLNENTLCYRIEGSFMVGVLAGSVLRGGHDPMSGMTVVGPGDKTRPATLADFAFFRVSPAGHIDAPETSR